MQPAGHAQYSTGRYIVFSRSDEEDFETLDWLPMAPEIEDPEEPGWGQLEVLYTVTSSSALFYLLLLL